MKCYIHKDINFSRCPHADRVKAYLCGVPTWNLHLIVPRNCSSAHLTVIPYYGSTRVYTLHKYSIIKMYHSQQCALVGFFPRVCVRKGWTKGEEWERNLLNKLYLPHTQRSGSQDSANQIAQPLTLVYTYEVWEDLSIMSASLSLWVQYFCMSLYNTTNT